MNRSVGLLSLRRRPRAKRRNAAFTLLELIVVLAIILVLVVLLIVGIIMAFSRGAEGETGRLFTEIQLSMQRWRAAYNYSDATYPRGRFDPSPVANGSHGGGLYAGNIELYNQLILRPERDERPALFQESVKQFTGYILPDGSFSVSDAKNAKPVFIDGWGQPIVFWEWVSRFGAAELYLDPTTHLKSERRLPEALYPFAEQRLSYDIYSSGADLTWGTNDDILGTDAVKGVSPVGREP